MRTSHLTAAAIVGLSATQFIIPTRAQTRGPVSPSEIDRSVIRPGARELGMGGTKLFGSGIQGAPNNPAAIGTSKGFSATANIAARTNGVDAKDITDLFSSIDDLNDAVDNNTAANFPQDAFDDLFDLTGQGGRTLRVNATPAVGVGFKNFGVVAYGSAFAQARLTANNVAANRSIDAGAGLLGMSNVALPLAYSFHKGRKNYGTLGMSLKYVRADYLAASFLADETTQQVVGTTFDRVNSNKFDIDLGYTSPELLKKSPLSLRGAVVIRNLLAPSFRLNANGTSRDVLGNETQTNFNGSFKQRTQFDAGLRVGVPRTRLVGYAEVHNITGKNGGDATYHIGGEYLATRFAALRLGYDDDKLTAGVGLNLSGLRLDLGVSDKPKERFALGVSYNR